MRLRLVLQTDPNELPHPRRQVEGSTSRAMPGQTSWSKALVRHGADPGAALAGVLGTAAEAEDMR